MSTLAKNLDLHDGDGSKEGSLAHPNVTLVEVRDVVESIDFIDSLETLFLDHGKGATRSLLGWLKQKSHTLVAWHLCTIGCNNLSSCHEARHVTVVTAHMRKLSLCLVRKALVVLWHG